MNLTINKHNGLALLIAEGTIEETSLKEIAREVEKLPSTTRKHVLLDCNGIRKITQSRIGFSGLVNHLLYLKSKDASITLFGCDEQAFRLIKLLKLENSFHFSPTLDEAYLSLPNAGKAAPASLTTTA